VATSIGVFTSREQAEDAAHLLVADRVPEDDISLLTPDTPEHRVTGKKVGAYVGGAIGTSTGLTLGIAAATLAVPGIGPVLAIGLGAAALLGFGGMRAGKSVGAGIDTLNDAEHDPDLPDAAFFRAVLAQNRSVIVVQTEDAGVHARASDILNRLAIHGTADEAVPTANVAVHKVSDVLVVALSGRVVIGEVADHFRDIVYNAIDRGARKVVINITEVTFIDSSGLGALVNAMIRMRNSGGKLKLTQPSTKVAELLELTRLDKVMDIEPDEPKALAAFA
jgi:anti-sigma B factor antagonist